MDDDSRVIDKGWDALPEYASKSGDADDAVTVSISTTPGEWLVNTVDAVVVPMSMAELVEALQSRKLTDRSLVWRAGMQEWASVDKVPQLKLAARMPLMASPTAPSSAPPRPSKPAAVAPSKPPPKPVRATPAPPAAAPMSPQFIPSRKATLPFGLTSPLGAQSRPANLRPSSSPRAAMPPPASKDEPEVLAVYTRPAATISFDLSPVQPRRAAPTLPPAPQTLAPTTTDSAQRCAPGPRDADLSVVAAGDFREVQRSSKRLVWISSLASAAAASLLTFALSRGAVAPSASPAGATQGLALTPPAPATLVAAPALASASPSTDTPQAPTPPSEPSATVAPAKPKALARRAKAVNVAPAPPPEKTESSTSSTRDPSRERNPYDVQLDDDAPGPKAEPATARDSGLEADGDAPQASSTGSTSPGL